MSQTAKAYAQGLYALAIEENLSKLLLEQLQMVNEIFTQEPQYMALLSSASLTKEERTASLDSCLQEHVHPYLLNLLKILAEKGYIRHFPQCCKDYEALYNHDNGILPVKAVTAAPMPAQQQEKLKEKLESVTGKKVQLTCRVDAACLGGIRLDFDGKRLDGTVAGRLASLAALLKNTSL
jgi:F-type H+-transporting ATPase subunit delta